MSASFHPPAGTFIEISDEMLHVLAGEHGLDVPLERLENGRLTAACRDRVVNALREYLEKHGGRGWQQAYCGINARGVSLRTLTVPAASGEELRRMLLLQLEREFPLTPAQLAWGFQRVNGRNGGAKTQQVAVAAIKKELLQEYADLLSAAGLRPTFTLAALARAAFVSPGKSLLSVNVGKQSELLVVQDGAPVSLRTISGNPHETTKRVHSENKNLTVYVSGIDAPALAQELAASSIQCEIAKVPTGNGYSAATLGLAKLVRDGETLPLSIEVSPSAQVARRVTPPAVRKWIGYAVLLALLCFGLRYAEAFIMTRRLAKRISEVKQYRESLPKVERDLAFLQYLKTNQPHYLDAVTVLAESTSPGTRIESLSLNRRGDLSMRASMRDAQQLTDLRSKLIRSELFSAVVVEEQTTTPDRQKLIVRMTGQWKPFAERKPPTAAIETSKSPAPLRTASRVTNAVPTSPQPSAPAAPAPQG